MVSKPDDYYRLDKSKVLLFPTNFDEIFRRIMIIRRSPWLPKEIKERLEFLNIICLTDISENEKMNCVKLNIDKLGLDPWMQSYPKITFEMFTINMSDLLLAIINWIETHSILNIDFDLIEKD